MNPEKAEAIRQQRSVSKQIILCVIAYITTVPGLMSAGFSAVALPPLVSDKNPYKLTPSQASWFVSILSIATPVGCLIAGPISDRYGRKLGVILVSFVNFVGWIFMSLAYEFPTNQYPILLLGRVITGLSFGMTTTAPIVYVTEISSPKLRGMITTSSGIFLALGILAVYMLGWIFKENWGIISTITALISMCLMVITQIFLPESPLWLVTKGKFEKASSTMCKIYGYKEQNDEVFEDIQALIRNRDASKINSTRRKTIFTSIIKKVDYFRKPTCFKPFVLILMYFTFLQFSGIFVIVYYAIDVVEAADVKIDPYKAIILIALIRLLAAILVTYLSRRFGRRPLSIVSGTGITLCMMTLSLYLYLKETGALNAQTLETLSSLPIFALTLHFFMSTLGFITIPFAMVAECFPGKIRGTATGVIISISYMFLFVLLKIFPAMLAGLMPHGLFLFFGTVSLIGTIFIIALLPETKGKTLVEIEEYFAGKKQGILDQKPPQ